MHEMTIQTASKTYPVFIGTDLLVEMKQQLTSKLNRYSKLFIITDQHVASLYQSHIEALLSKFSNLSFFCCAKWGRCQNICGLRRCNDESDRSES